jgi:glycosyltransferase involved in cell wall biosynthesis
VSHRKADSRLALSQPIPRAAARGAGLVRSTCRPVAGLLRARLRGLVSRYDKLRSAPQVDTWSAPLIGTGSGPSGARAGLDSPFPPAGPGPAGPAAAIGPGPRSDRDLPGPRCLIVTSMLNTGGLQEVAAVLARRLPEFGLRTAVLDVRPDPSGDGRPSGYLGQVLHSSGTEVHETDEAGVPAWIERWRPDVLAAHGALPGAVLATANLLDVPYVDTLHGMHDLFDADWRAEASRAAQVSAIISVSELVRQQYLAGNPGFPPARIVTIPNGVDEERRRGVDRATARHRLGLRDEYVFVSLSRHCLQKNTYGLLAAFGEMARHRPEVHLVVAGKLSDARYGRRVLRLRETLSCRDRIHLRDHLEAPARLLAAADGFVLDSFFEGWPLASMEALHAGLPVVLSDMGGAREQVGDDPSRGYLVANPLGDPLQVNWESMRIARYRPQPNQDELVTALEKLVAGRHAYLRDRAQLAAESAARFRGETCVAHHAAVLQAVTSGAELPPLLGVHAA